MSKVVRIALTGKMRSGKSTLATELSVNGGFKTISFGSSLKHYADQIFAESDVYPIEDIVQSFPIGGVQVVGSKKPRKLYQDFGQAMRELDPNVWIQHAEKSMSTWENMRSIKGIVIDDLRQPNEYDWCRENGFIIIRVVSNEENRIRRIKEKGDDFNIDDLDHDTERHSHTFDVDYEIENDGNFSDFKEKIRILMETLQ